MKSIDNFKILIVISVILISVIIFSSTKENLTNDLSWLPEKKFLDSVSANNVLTFTNNKECDGKSLSHINTSWDINQDCYLNPQYLHSMCLQKRKNKTQLCNSINGVVQFPQNNNHPKNFEEF